MKPFITIKNFLMICSLILLALTAKSQITVGTPGGSGGVAVSGTWAKGSTVTVYDHMLIPAGQSLTIQEGVTVLIADTSLKIEMIVLGNLYCLGTATNPINFTVKPNLIPASVATTNAFPGLWASVITDTTCAEMLLLYTNMKYYGAATTNNSPSVLLHLYKNAAGQTTPFINYRNHNGGKLVIEHCTFSNGTDDGLYVEGGNVIFAYNTIHQNGSTGGDAFNMKAGTVADCAFNLFYSPNTNACKLSNTGSRSPQANITVYNNTIVNSGWRRPTVKGGSIWYEAGVVGKSYNNLMVNARFGIKTDGAADTASKADYNYYFGNWQNVIKNFNAPTAGLFSNGSNDIKSATPGDKDPLFKNYPLSTDTMNSKLDTAWDFHPKAGSPAIGAGTANVPRNFSTTGITILGTTYLSPAPSTTIGAFSQYIASGIQKTTSDKDLFVIYPVPAKDYLTIEFRDIPSQTSIALYSVIGTKIDEKTINMGENELSFNTSVLQSGIYFVVVKNGNFTGVKQFIKN